MIITELKDGQGLGNQLWCYVVTRTIAKDKGYEFGIKHPEKFKGNDFLQLDFGLPVVERGGPKNNYQHSLPEGITNFYAEKKIIHPKNGFDIRLHDENLVNVSDQTEIEGVMQDEQYIIHRKKEIRNWLKIKPGFDCQTYSSPDICVINFRGGGYVVVPSIFLSKKYWDDAISHMLKVNPKFKFIVVTDDVKTAKKFFPKFDVFHWSIGKDYGVILNAHYLILSNSSFAWFPAWLNTKLKLCIAPKYWAQYNTSDGFWSCGYNLTSGWMYLDREGKFSNYEICKNEFELYIQKHPEYFINPDPYIPPIPSFFKKMESNIRISGWRFKKILIDILKPL